MGDFLFRLLGTRGDFKGVPETTAEVVKIVNICVSVFYGLVLALMVFFAIYVAWRLMKAEDDSQRKQAKSQLFYSIVGIVGVGILIVFIRVVIPTIAAIKDTSATYGSLPINDILNAVNNILSCIMQIILALVGIFACYVAWQFIKAEDDGKRKQAKLQLVYCFIAIVGLVLFNLVATTVLTLAKKGGIENSTVFQLFPGYF